MRSEWRSPQAAFSKRATVRLAGAAGQGQDARMSGALVLIIVVVGAYLAAHVAFEWIARRFLIVSGAEYLLLGILIGPHASGLIGTGVVGTFAPFMTLALGWIGLLIGAQFSLPEMVRINRVFYRVAAAEAVVSLVVISAAMTGAVVLLTNVPASQAWIPGLVLGSLGTASAPSPIALVVRRLGRRVPLTRQLEVSTAIDSILAIVVFSLLLCVIRQPAAVLPRSPTATEWAVISVAIGLVAGALFHLFLGPERKIDRLFIALVGAVILASGAAAHMALSPLLPAAIIGAILVNTSQQQDEMRQVMVAVERPLYFVLLIFAGAAWNPIGEAGVVGVIAVFLVVRVGAKLGSARFAAWVGHALPALGPGWGKALLGQGGLALAIGLNYVIKADSILPNTVFTAVVASVLLTDLFSARFAQSALDSAPSQPRAAAHASSTSAVT